MSCLDPQSLCAHEQSAFELRPSRIDALHGLFGAPLIERAAQARIELVVVLEVETLLRPKLHAFDRLGNSRVGVVLGKRQQAAKPYPEIALCIQVTALSSAL